MGSWLLGLLAVASVAVLVGGRMAEQIRRVGLLKAIGGTPGLVAAVLLAEYMLLSLIAAAAGLGVGWLVAPLLTKPGGGLLGTAGAPPLTIANVGVVVALALAVAVVATLVPAIRAATHQHGARPGRCGPSAPPSAMDHHGIGAAACPAVARNADGRPPTAPDGAHRAQYRRHRQRDRRRVERPCPV